jgi:hypothetical protein
VKNTLSILPSLLVLGISGQALAIEVDMDPPQIACVEAVNPHGQTTPPAGSTTLPGAKGGQNEDGFYQLFAVDDEDPNPAIYITDTGSGAIFGPFQSGSIVKITEDPEGVPEAKTIGSTNGQAGAVDSHLILLGDPAVFALDSSGNTSNQVECFVPPPPK